MIIFLLFFCLIYDLTLNKSKTTIVCPSYKFRSQAGKVEFLCTQGDEQNSLEYPWLRSGTPRLESPSLLPAQPGRLHSSVLVGYDIIFF